MVLTQTSVEKNQTTSSFAKARDIPRMLQDFSSPRIAVAIISRWWYEGMSDQIQKWAPEFQAPPIKWCQVPTGRCSRMRCWKNQTPDFQHLLWKTTQLKRFTTIIDVFFELFCRSLLSFVHRCTYVRPNCTWNLWNVYSVCFYSWKLPSIWIGTSDEESGKQTE